MAEEIASLKLKIDVQSVDEANRKLNDFSKTAENAASATDNFGSSQQIVKNSLSQTAKEVADVHKRIAEYRKNLTANTNSAKKFAQSSDKLYETFRNQLESLNDINSASKELVKIRQDVTKSYKDGQIDLNNYRQLLSDLAIKQRDVTTAEKIATNAKATFISKLKEQLATQNMSKTELLRYKAAQLGVSSAADIYIKKISQSTNETKKLGVTASATKHQLSTMMTQMMRGNFSGVKSSSMSMIMKNGIGNTFGSMLTSLNPINIGISAMVGLLGSMIPKLFESESATEKLAAAQERLNKALSTDKKTGLTFLSEEMTELLKKSPSLVKALLRNSEKDASTAISSIKDKLKDSFIEMESFTTEFTISQGTNGQSGLRLVLKQIQNIKERGQDLNEALKSTDRATAEFVSGIQGKIEAYSKYFDITKEQAKDLLVELSDINSETDSIKAEEKITALINRLSELYTTSNSSDEKFKNLIDGLAEIAKSADKASAQLQFLRFINENANKAIDPKKSPFYQYSQMILTRSERIKSEINEMREQAKKSNEINPGSVTDKMIMDAEEAIKKRHAEREKSSSNLLQTSKQHEISLKNQLNSMREEVLSVNKITNERKKYLDLQAQIKTLEDNGNQSRLSNQEKYLLANKKALLVQYEKNAAISEEIMLTERASKARLEMKEYADNLERRLILNSETRGMTSRMTNRYSEMSELEHKRNTALENTSNPTQIAQITEEYNRAKQLLEMSWQEEDAKRSDWITGLKVGLNEFSDSATDVFTQFSNLAQQSMNSVSNALTELVISGKMDFKSLAKSILKNIVEIINKLLIAKAIQSSMSWFGGGASTGGLQQAYTGGEILGYASGGSVGYAQEPGGFTGRGNKYQPAGIVHKGEFVFTKEATKRLGVNYLYSLMNDATRGYSSGGYTSGNVSNSSSFTGKTVSNTKLVQVVAKVNVNNTSQNNRDESVDESALAKAYKQTLEKSIQDGIKRELDQGGVIWTAMHSR